MRVVPEYSTVGIPWQIMVYENRKESEELIGRKSKHDAIKERSS